ncbi:MAG: hypothetical protein K2N51_21115 [Lachnospiraceae bacterium]|nr:hypothetical protein [Lachnospiraceae bacterium]
MRMYGYVKEPFKANKKDTIYKIMIHEIKKHEVMVYLYTSKDAISCSFDHYYPDIESALEDWQDEIDEQGWIHIEDPLPDCQHDAFLPIRVKGRDSGNPQWEQLEILEDGVWREYKEE